MLTHVNGISSTLLQSDHIKWLSIHITLITDLLIHFLVKKGCFSIFGILYHNNFFVKKFRQNDVIGVSAFCQKGVFGNMSVHCFSCISSIIIKRDRGLFDQNSLDRNCVISVDRNFHNQLTEFFETFQLIKKFDQLPKNNLQILAVDQKF